MSAAEAVGMGVDDLGVRGRPWPLLLAVVAACEEESL
eukprot:CAMPEP_0196133970 /NCGR_PEP_ID=MMETSP0910-20130528/2985_1 /TAXON_ID=49265 /ORGANISM="Thalassiosira rotula, Strain GSO102" /LENGTH=36 /DNA_ID= /DNA_START= /DNA_END= /DNA_ORIENTATION=